MLFWELFCNNNAYDNNAYIYVFIFIAKNR